MIDLDDIAGPGLDEDDLKPFHGAVVVNGEITYWSVSSLQLGDPLTDGGCHLKWHKRYVQRLDKGAQTTAQSEGDKLHLELKTYLRSGVRALGALAMTGLHLLPDPALVRAGLVAVETPLDYGPLRADGLPFTGAIDIENRSGENRGGTDIEATRDPDGTVEVADHKTTGEKPSKSYMKLGRELDQSIQMVGYAVHVIHKYAAPWVRLSHNYFFTKQKRAAEKRTHLFPAEHLLRRWDRTEALARELRDVAREPDENKIRPNLDACSAFGGCPYRGTCTAGAATILASMFPSNPTKDTDMGILDEILNDNRTTSAPSPEHNRLREAWSTIENAPGVWGLPKLAGAALEAITAAYGVKFMPSGKLGGIEIDTVERLVELADKMRAKFASSAAPQADMPALTAPINPAPAGNTPAEKDTATAPAPTETAPTTPPPSSSVEPSAGAAPAAKPPKKSKRQAIPKVDAPITTTTDLATSPLQLDPQVADAIADSFEDRAVDVFVDCTPSHGATDLRVIVDGWMVEAAKRAGCLDIRLSDKDLFAFGKWKAWLVAHLRESITPGRYTLDTRGSEVADVVADALRSICAATGGEYVRGVR